MASQDLKVDVAIIGAGPVGLFCAHLLAKDGIKVAIFEKEAEVWSCNDLHILQKDGMPVLIGIDTTCEVLCLHSCGLPARIDMPLVNISYVDGFANGHVRTGVGFVRIRLACESVRIANP